MPIDCDTHEDAVVSSCRYIGADNVRAIGAIVQREHFQRPWKGIIFAACVQLSEDGGDPADPEAVASLITVAPPHGVLSWVDAYLSITPPSSTTNTAWHARRVREHAVRRNVRMQAQMLGTHAEDPEVSVSDLLMKLHEMSMEVADQAQADHTITSREAVEGTWEYIQEAREQKGKHRIWTGNPDVDGIVGGFGPGDLVVLAARTSVGKTAYGCTITKWVLEQAHRPVLFVSLEMPAHQVICRLAALGLKKSLSRIIHAHFDSIEEEQCVQHYLEDIGEMPLHLFAPGGGRDASPHPDVVRAEARNIKARHGDIGLIVIDYLQLMEMARAGRAASRQEEVAAVSRRLKLLALDLKVPVLALSQIRRSQAGKEDDVPHLSDLRESGAIENDADTVMILHRDVPASAGTYWVARMSLHVAKNRNGPTTSGEGIPMLFKASTGAFAAVSTEKEQE